MVLLLLSDLNIQSDSEPVPPNQTGRTTGEPAYLLQLFLDRPLLLGDVTELGGVLLSQSPARSLGRPLLGRQRLLGLPVSGNLVLQEALLHLQELLRLPEPLLILTPLGLI